MSGVLLSLWIALIGADRIDLAGGHGPFILTPFLVLTPLVAAAELVRRAMLRRPLVVSRRLLVYGVVTATLLTMVLISVYRAIDVPTSASRAILLVAQVCGTLVVAVLCSDREELTTILARGALWSMLVFALFNANEALWWIGRGPELWRVGTLTLAFDNLQNLSVLPRVAGPVGDANRAGFVLLFYIFVLSRSNLGAVARRGAIALSVLFLVLTFSRSAMMGGVVALPLALLSRRRPVSVGALASAAVAATAVIALIFVDPSLADRAGSVAAATVGSRFSASEGSAQDHLALIERGVHEGMESLPRAAFGLGYGNAYLVLQDVFPGNRYGNFHSLYVTMFAEAGIAALLATLVLTFGPIVMGSPWMPVVAGAIAFNLFYQTATEPVFWFLLAVGWVGRRKADGGRRMADGD